MPDAPDPRWWHRRWLPLGPHRPQAPLHGTPGAGFPPLYQCRCRWVGVQLGEYARLLGAPVPEDHPLATEWVWMPQRVWAKAWQEVW